MRRLATMLFLTGVLVGPTDASSVVTDGEARAMVAREIEKVLRPEGIGAAVAVLLDGRTLFFNFGFADRAGKRPVTPDSLFNLASVSKVFDATLLSLAIRQGELSFDDPVAKYVRELADGGDVRHITLGQLATFTSGFSLPQDHPPWPAAHYTLPRFLSYLRNWKIDKNHQPGRQYIYSHAGFMLLHLALERRFGMPYAALLNERLLRRLNLSSTTLPLRRANSIGLLPPALLRRAVQGYSGEGKPIGKPGNVQGYYHWAGTGQMFSSARDLAVFLAAHLGELPDLTLREAAELSQREVARVGPNVMQAQAWEVHHHGALAIVDKNGGLDNTTTYVGMIANKRLAIAILINRGALNGRDVGHPILRQLAQTKGAAR